MALTFEPTTNKALTFEPTTNNKLVEDKNTKTTVKELNGHRLILLKRPRVKGFCVECIMKKSDPNYKQSMIKITTYCATCPGGNWICEPCFNEKHTKQE